jgi:hypothetical protein
VLLLATLLLLYPLGALVEAALDRSGATTAAPETLFRRLVLGLLLAAWAGVALAEAGGFSAARLALLVAGATLVLAVVQARRGGIYQTLGLGPWRWRRDLSLAGVVLLAALLFARPGEDVLGARDPGIYFASGVAIARAGGVLQHDPALAALGAGLADESLNYWLFQSVHGWPLRFPGQLFARDLAAGTVEPGFMPWYPVAVAVAVGAGGLQAGLWVNPALSVLAVAAVFLVGRRAFGGQAAALGAALLALNLGELWFARYTMAEPAAQLLVWTGLYAVAAARARPTAALALLGGLAWGGTLLARVDTLLLLPVAIAYLAWQTRAPRWRRWALGTLAVLALVATQAAWHAWQLAPGYASMTFSRATLAVAAGGIVLSLLLAAATWGHGAVWRPAHRGWRVLPLVAVLVGGSLFAFLVRPALPAAGAAGEAAELEQAARESLVRLGWYVTPPGLALAVVGGAALALSGRWRRAPLLVALLALSLAFYLPNPLVSADHPWAVRRYLPVVLPGLCLLAGYGAVVLGRLAARRFAPSRLVRRAAPPILAALVALGEWGATAPIFAHREHAGAVSQTLALADAIPADALVLFPRSGAGMRLAMPLHYLGERQAFVLPAVGFEAGVTPVVRRWLEEGRVVWWVVPEGTRFPTPPGLRLSPAGRFEFAVPQLERPVDRLPRIVEPQQFALQLYRLQLAPAADAAP